MLRDAWTEERREEARQQAETRYAAWSREHPERAAVVAAFWHDVEAGSIERPACPNCARPSHPAYDWERMAAVGWRCQHCKSSTEPMETDRGPAAHGPSAGEGASDPLDPSVGKDRPAAATPVGQVQATRPPAPAGDDLDVEAWLS